MKRYGRYALTLGLLAGSSLPLAAGAASTGSSAASFTVGLRIVEACTIQAGGSAGKASARVECAHGSPWQLIEAPASSSQDARAGLLTVAF